MKNIDPSVYRLVDTYNINQVYLAERVFADEWKEAGGDSQIEKRLVGRLRNKIMGFGRMLPVEYNNLLNAISEIADDLRATVDSSISRRNEVRKEKIKKLLIDMDDQSLDDLLDS
ncbi:hypothetical protein [Rufibacter sp. DG15C]|uniref:hypothetical protein n=1 Tax=Rufibacter sp. DG15C TaxID=1379909 RepID=UPI0012F891B2|nr:hypothetical protein [Rufibacter sp. DG15C]